MSEFGRLHLSEEKDNNWQLEESYSKDAVTRPRILKYSQCRTDNAQLLIRESGKAALTTENTEIYLPTSALLDVRKQRWWYPTQADVHVAQHAAISIQLPCQNQTGHI